MARQISKRERRLIRRILRVVLSSFLGLLVILLLLTGYLYLNRDNISSWILMSMDRYVEGELSFESLSFTPFAQFPSISLMIRDLEFYENPIDRRNQNEVPVLTVGKLYAAIDIMELIRGRADISKVLVEEGKAHLIQYPDSSYNFLNATDLAGSKSTDYSPDTMPVAVKDSSLFELNLDQILLEDFGVVFDNRIEKHKAEIGIISLKSRFQYTPGIIRSMLEAEIDLETLVLSGVRRLENSKLHLETSLLFDRQDLNLEIQPSELGLDLAKLKLEGDINFKDDGNIDLEFSGSDDEFRLSSVFLSQTGIDNLEKGDLYFMGTVRDQDFKGMPLINLDFGINNVRIYIPGAGDYIEDLNLSGRFTSGNLTDMSEARLEVDTIYAGLPGGYVNGEMIVENFYLPEFYLDWQLQMKLDGIEQIFNLGFLDSLSGSVNSRIKLDSASFNPLNKEFRASYFDADILLDSVRVNFPDIMSVKTLHGRVNHTNDTTRLSGIRAEVDDSDFLVDGEIRNASFLPFKIDTPISADLAVQSEMFDLPGFLDFVPEVRESFPYRIKNIDLEVGIFTSTERFLQMRPNPSMTFDIRNLDGEIENLLPPLSMKRGLFALHHRNNRTYLNFTDFLIEILESSLELDLEYNSPAKNRDYIVMDIGVEGLNPGQLLFDEETDTIPEFLDGALSCSFGLDIHFPHDSTLKLEKVDLKQADLLYINTLGDTILANSLNLLAEQIEFDTEQDPNPLASMTADIVLSSETTRFNSLTWIGYYYSAEAREGKYVFHPSSTRLFGKAGSGTYTLDPFSEQPSFKIQYQVEQYEVKDLMSGFLQDTLISGKMDFGIDVLLKPEKDTDMLSSLNGVIILRGDNLRIYGVDLDDLIRKFEKSQNFNLVDLGAVALMGPVGLALSKGGSYANIIATDLGESSVVTSLNSQLNITGGRVQLQDVAFATRENRVAANGQIDLPADSLDITFAVIDKHGCSIIYQRLYGSMQEPERSRVRFLETILAPVTNLIESAFGRDCDPFYTGSVDHPVKD